jgi:type IV pilus assembly protein PilV
MSMSARRAQGGFTLLESLIALVITAVALLGMIGVQLRSLADTQTGVRRAQAVRLIEDLSERIQANPQALLVLDQYAKAWGAQTGNGPACTKDPCDAIALAQHDIDQWRQAVKATLPLADATTFRGAGQTVAGTRRQLGVMVSWRENETAKADASYRKPWNMNSTDSNQAAVSCPSGSICHLQFLQPNARCTVSTSSSQQQLYCPAIP